MFVWDFKHYKLKEDSILNAIRGNESFYLPCLSILISVTLDTT